VNEALVFDERLDTSMAPEMGAAALIASSLSYQSYPAFTWRDECIASNSYIGLGAAKGTLSVDSTPIKAECFVNNESWGVTPKTKDVSVGNYTISWANVKGYITPAPQKDMVVANQSTTITGVYIEIPPSPPSWSNLGHNSTDIGTVSKFSALWRDADGLSGYIFSWNGTGTWTNSSFVRWGSSPTSAWSNVTKVLPTVKGVRVGYRFYANETYKGWNATRIGTLVTTKPPTWEATQLTMSYSFTKSGDKPALYTVKGSLTFAVNGTSLRNARLMVYVGYDNEFGLIGTDVTDSSGKYQFKWYPSMTGDLVLRIVYVSDRNWVLGTRIEKLFAVV